MKNRGEKKTCILHDNDALRPPTTNCHCQLTLSDGDMVDGKMEKALSSNPGIEECVEMEDPQQGRECARKMLSLLFETGHPWITFKDPCNLRSPQQHVGVIHSSNLCTEITLNTNEEEVAVCNLGSINLAAHVTEKGLDLILESEGRIPTGFFVSRTNRQSTW